MDSDLQQTRYRSGGIFGAYPATRSRPLAGKGDVVVKDAAVAAHPGLSRRSLLSACAFMEANIGRRLSLNDLARAACVSRAHFARQFRLSTGTTPMAFLLLLRIQRAKQLLADGIKVSAVAAELGFCDQSHFSRTFREMTGSSPGIYARTATGPCGDRFGSFVRLTASATRESSST
jgi:AraC family transcriptional regulator